MKIFRWYGILIFGIFMLCIYLFLTFKLDSIIKNFLESSLSKVLNKPVEIEKVKANIFSLSLNLKKIHIVNTKNLSTDLMQLQEVSFNISSNQLSKGKYFIEDLTVKDLVFNAKREKPYKTESKENLENKNLANNVSNYQQKKSLKYKFSFLDKLEKISVKDLIKNESLKIVKLGEEKKKQLENILKKWEENVKEIQNEKQKLKELKQKINKLKHLAKNIRNLEDISKIKNEINSINKEINKEVKKIKSLKEQLNNDIKLVKKFKQEILQAYKEDKQRIKEKYSLNLEGGLNVVELLFGENIRNYLEKFVEGYKIISKLITSGEEKQKELEKKRYRLEGKFVKYKEINPLPDIVIKKADVSLYLFNSKLLAMAKNFSDNQKLYKKPFEIKLEGKENKNFKSIFVFAKFDRVKNMPKDLLKFKILNLKLDKISLSNDLYIENSVVNINGNLNIENTKNLDGYIKFNFIKVNLISENELLKNLFKDLKSFFVNIKASGQLDNPKFSYSSDLERKLSSKIKKLLNSKLDKLNKDLDKTLKSYMDKYIKDIDSSEKGLNKYLDKFLNVESKYLNLGNLIKKEFSVNKLKEKLQKNLIKSFKF